MNYSAHITIAADSVERLRRCDVFRLVDCCPADHRDRFCDWLEAQRPDLADEIAESLSDAAGGNV